jgi:hypothetical protein
MMNIERRGIDVECSGLCWDIHTFEKGGEMVREWHER